MLSGRKAARGASHREREARTREPGPEKSQKSSGGIGFAGQSVLASPQDHGTGVASLCAARKDACKGWNPSRTFTVVSVRRQVGSKPSLHSPPPHPLFLSQESFGTPTTDRWRGRSRAAGCVLPMGPRAGDMWCTVTSHSDGGVEERTSQLETSSW